MENFIISINMVLPLFLSIGYGYILKRLGILEEDILYKLNTIVFRAFFPLLMFYNIYKGDITQVLNPKLILFAVAFLLALIGLLYFIIPLIEKENARRGVLIQAIYRSNFIIFGLTLVNSLYGEEKTGAVAMLVAVIVPLFNIFAVIILELFQGSKIKLIPTVKALLKNPLIIGALWGVIFVVFKITLPDILSSTLANFASVTTPLSLIILGGTFRFGAFSKLIKQLAIGVTGRLFIVPAIGMWIATALGFRGPELLGLLAMMASPVAISSYPMAQQMGGDGELAGQLVIWSSAVSIITMFLWIFALKHMGLI